jgi:hypothetical protein
MTNMADPIPRVRSWDEEGREISVEEYERRMSEIEAELQRSATDLVQVNPAGDDDFPPDL